MKILVVGFPRSGTKFLTENLINYIGGQKIDNTVLMPSHLYNNIDIQDFFNNRIQTVKNVTVDSCFKLHHYIVPNNILLSDNFLSIFDNIFHIQRRNIFELLLSNSISSHTGSWSKDDFQDTLIDNLTKNKIKINVDNFRSLILRLNRSNSLSLKNEKIIFTEDIVKCRTSEEFCKLLELNFRDFEVIHKPEFGNNKMNMIQNLHQLQSCFDYEKTRLGL